MNEEKQKQLWAAARACPPVEAPAQFTAQVWRKIRREGRSAAAVSLFDQLAVLFPRLTAVALVVIAAGMTFEFQMSGDLLSQLVQVSDQLLLPMTWL